jgi:Protein of unknown function (DUF1501)
MLNVFGTRKGTTCDGATRRDFLRVGALGMSSLTLPGLLKARGEQTKLGKPTKNTSVVWLWLGGGPTHVETFDPKMSAPVEFRSVTGAVQTNVKGIEIGGTFEKMAKVADKMAFVRSFAHTNSGHGGGTHWVMTGYNFVAADNGGGQSKPGMGSILARHRGANAPTGLPTYVRMNGILGDGPNFLGAPYAPFDVAGRARQNMNLTVAVDRLSERKELLKGIDTLDREIDNSGLMNGLDSFEGQAFDLIMSKAKETFDIKNENPQTIEKYGKGLGEQMLLARRLCEAGVGFVTLNYGGWDMHGNIGNAMKQRTPSLDQAVSAFVSDCAERGIDKNVLLVISGEFGRTPRINNNAGRDHWAPLSTLALSGGGLKMGQIVGESSDKAERPKSTPIGPQDLMATVFHVLGIPQDLHFKDPSGRPTPMINGGKPIAELV